MRLFTFSLFAALLSAPAFAADLGTYRPGTPYSSAIAGGADVCDNQCAGDAQCRGWNYVKPNPRAAGVCEFLSSVSTPIPSQISISGESHSAAPYYSGLMTGGTNTVRVGKQPASNTVRVGEAPQSRRIVRQPVPERVTTQKASTQRVENMSLTAQQNRYRQEQVGMPQPSPRARPQIQGQRQVPGQRPMFRPILDGTSPQVPGQQLYQPQTPQSQGQPTRRQETWRATGPRRVQGQGTPAPQFQDPRMQAPQQNLPQPYGQAPQPFQQAQAPQQRGQSRPPIGQPIPAPQAIAPQALARPQRPMTPSQRLAQFTAQAQMPAASATGSVALTPEQARTSLFGKLNDDVAMPTVSAVPTQPVTEQPLDEALAGGR